MKYQVIVAFLLITFLPITANGQELFNKRYTFNSIYSHFESVVTTDNKIYAVGIKVDSISDTTASLVNFFSEIDKNGVIKWTYIPTYDTLHSFLWPFGLYLSTSGQLITACRGYGNLYMVKFDPVQFTFTHKIIEPMVPQDNFFVVNHLLQLNDGNFLVSLSSKSTPITSSQVDPHLILLDPDFNIIWRKTYRISDVNDPPISAVGVGENIYVAVSHNNFAFVDTGSFSTIKLLKVRASDGELLDETTIQSGYILGRPKDLTIDDNQNIYIATAKIYLDTVIVGGNYMIEIPYQCPMVIKLDENMEFLWSKEFVLGDSTTQQTYFSEVEWNDNEKEIILAGHIAVPDTNYPMYLLNDYKGVVVAYSENGDKIWDRVYSGVENTVEWHWINDMVQTNDMGYLLCGRSNTSGIDTVNSDTLKQSWLLKLDSKGCVMPGCHLPTSNLNFSAPIPSITVYPNPASSNLYIINDDRQSLQLQLFDLQGRLVKTASMDSDSQIIDLGTDGLSGGYFILVATTPEGHRIVKKIEVFR